MLAHHVKEGGARILDKMPTIGDLDRLWCALGRGLAVAGAAAPGDKIDCRMTPKLCSGGVALAVWKKRHNAVPLQVADDGSVSASSTPRPIVNPNRAKRPTRASGAASNRSQERIFADGNGESFRETMSRPAAKGETEPMNDALQAGCSSCERHRDAFAKPFGEYLPGTDRGRAAKAADHDIDLDGTAVRRQIGQRPLVSTMDPARGTAARRAK
jgi:hypothetical protein